MTFQFTSSTSMMKGTRHDLAAPNAAAALVFLNTTSE
jgi:hypothetical protein